MYNYDVLNNIPTKFSVGNTLLTSPQLSASFADIRSPNYQSIDHHGNIIFDNVWYTCQNHFHSF